jgi:hypothetical protein
MRWVEEEKVKVHIARGKKIVLKALKEETNEV